MEINGYINVISRLTVNIRDGIFSFDANDLFATISIEV